MKKNHKLGFSLVEISVVVLIIGVLIAAVTTGARLVKKYKIASAQNLSTNNSIYAMKDLVLWFEPTLASSFNNFDSIADGDELDAWLNNSPSYNIGNAVQATSDNQPIYVKYTINDIPSVTFKDDAGTKDDYLEINDVASLLENSDLSIFILEKRNQSNDDQIRNIITSSGNGINISYNASNKIVVKDNDGDDVTITEDPRDVNLHYLTLYDGVDNAGDYDFKIAGDILIEDGYYHYLNKKLPESGAMSGANEIVASGVGSSRFDIGSIGNGLRLGSNSNSFVGNISEVIIFNRKLRKQELLDIFRYFEAKYNLSLSTS